MRRSFFRFNEERFLHGIFVLCLLSDMGHGKAKANGKAKHECHVCGKSGHHSTSCPQLAQDLLKALTKQCRAEDLSEHLRQQKHLRCVGVKSRPRRSLKKASGHRGSSFKTWKAASPTQKSRKQTRKRGSKKKHKEKDHLRKPRAMKDHAKQKNALKETSSKPTTISKNKPGCGNPRHVPTEDRGFGLPTKNRNIVDGVACSGDAQTAADSAMSWITVCFPVSTCLCPT